MFKKNFGKKILAFVLAGCMLLPGVNYLSGVFSSQAVQVSAASYSQVPVTVTTSKDPSGTYLIRKYFLTDVTDAAGNPVVLGSPESRSSEFYTKYRKSTYYLNGDIGDGSGGISGSNAGYQYVRYEADGNRKTSLKKNPNAEQGSADNPLVVVEILPDELASQFSLTVKGQELFDIVYTNLFANQWTFSSLLGYGSITSEKAPTPWGGYNYSGIWYSNAAYTKEVFGYGYREHKLAQAPEIDRYMFMGWYVSDTLDENTFKDANKLGTYVFPADTSAMNLHLYAKWKYQSYDNNLSDSSNVLEGDTYCNTTGTNIDDSKTDTIDSQNGVSGVKAKVKYQGPWGVQEGEKSFASITFHYALPTGEYSVDVDGNGTSGEMENADTDTDGDGLKGEYEKINIAPKAGVSFINDYNFDATIPLTGNDIFNDVYPSLMGNTDYNILKENGNVQVVVIKASEFKDGDHEIYKQVLDNADMIFLADKAYSNTLGEVTNLARSSGNTNEVKADIYRNLLRTDVMHTIEDVAINSSTLELHDSTTSVLTTTPIDLEAYVVQQLWKNMAADNPQSKKVPVLTQSTIANAGNTKLNIVKLIGLVAANEDFNVAYAKWKDRITIKPDSEVSGYPANEGSDNVLVLKDFAGVEHTNWPVTKVFFPYDGNCAGSSEKWTPSMHDLEKIPGFESKSGGNLKVVAGSEFAKLVEEGWLYNGESSSGHGFFNTNTAITKAMMIYNSNNALVQQFLKTGNYNDSNSWNTDGFEYLREKGEISNSQNNLTTGLAIHAFLFSGGGKADKIVIDNAGGDSYYSDTYGKTVNVIDSAGADTTPVFYHMDTNEGTEYRMAYYEINSGKDFKNNLWDTIATGNATKLALSEAITTDGVMTFGRMSAGSLVLNTADVKPIVSNVICKKNGVEQNMGDGVKLENNVERTGTVITRDNRLVGTSFTTTGVDASTTKKFVIVAYHNDKTFYDYALVEIKVSNTPFNLD